MMMYNTFMVKNKFLSFVFFTAVTYLASFIGGVATISSKEPWYSSLNKSFLTPPDWIFAPIWTILYLLMAIAIWNAWVNKRDKKLIYIYLIHLFFNTTWSIVFFVYHSIPVALINLIVIIIFIIYLILRYKDISNLSFYLMIPYLLWSCYALILNLTLLILN
jgi:benzodiazapine receptor